MLAPRLLLYYNGFVVREYDTRYPSQRATRQNEVVAALADHLVAQGYARLEIRSRSPLDDVRPLLSSGWSASPSYTYVVPLDDLELLWSRVDQNLRRLVERARGLGLELVVDGDFDAFYDLHAATGERKDAPIYLPRTEFRQFYEQLNGHGLCTLYQARDADGTVVAGQLVLLGHPVTHTVSAAADAERQKSGSNPFLRWSVFEHLAAQGYAANDLTDASLGSVARFKSQLGGDLAMSFVARTAEHRRVLGPACRPRRSAPRALARAEVSLRGSGAEILCAELRRPGVEHVFGVPGTALVEVWEALRREPGIRVVRPTSELTASFMANGYARASGRTAVLCTIAGPGLTYAVSGIAEALLDSVPLVHVVDAGAGSEAGRLARTAGDSSGRRPLAAREGRASTCGLGGRGRVRRPCCAGARRAGEPGPVLLQVDVAALQGPATGSSPSPAASVPSFSADTLALVADTLLVSAPTAAPRRDGRRRRGAGGHAAG